MGSVTPTAAKFKVVLVQMRPKPNDPSTNFTHAASEIRSAISSNPDTKLAVVPEFHLTGFDPSSPEFIPACQTSHTYLEQYQTLARELNICICTCMVLTPTPEDPNVTKYSGNDDDNSPTLLNTAYFISSTGEIIGSYTKTNLWHPERDHLTASIDDKVIPAYNSVSADHKKPSTHEEALPEPHQVIDTPLGKVGLLICWDLAFPEAFRSLIMQGAKIIVIPTAWTEEDMSPEGRKYNKNAEALFLQTTLIARAYENTCAVVFCNIGGPKEDGYIGLSQVALPVIGPVDGSFTGSEEGVKAVEVDMEILEVAERNYKIRADLAKSDWHYGYTK